MMSCLRDYGQNHVGSARLRPASLNSVGGPVAQSRLLFRERRSGSHRPSEISASLPSTSQRTPIKSRFMVSAEVVRWRTLHAPKQVAERVQIFINLSESDPAKGSELLREFRMY